MAAIMGRPMGLSQDGRRHPDGQHKMADRLGSPMGSSQDGRHHVGGQHKMADLLERPMGLSQDGRHHREPNGGQQDGRPTKMAAKTRWPPTKDGHHEGAELKGVKPRWPPEDWEGTGVYWEGLGYTGRGLGRNWGVLGDTGRDWEGL